MTRKHWVRRMPWQLAAAGAVAGAVFGVSALYSASPAFADCGRGPGNCNSNAGGHSTNFGNNNGGQSNPFVQQQQPQQQIIQINGRGQSNNNSGPSNNAGPSNNNGQNGQTWLQQWQGNQQQGNQQHGNGQTAPTLNQNVQQFVQQLQDQWQQPQQQQPTSKPQVTTPAYVPPPVVQPVVIAQAVVDPPPAPVVQVQTTTPRRHSTNNATVVNSQPVADVVAAVNSFLGDPPKVNPAASAAVSANSFLGDPPKVNPPAPVFKPVVPNFTPPVQQAAAPPLVNQNSGGPNLFDNNNNDDDHWWDHHHHHMRPHDPPPPPPLPPVVYYPPVFNRTVVSCASALPYNQAVYPYGNVPYGYQGMPYGYNPYIFNQPVAPNYAPTYGFGQGSIYQAGYPYNSGYPYNAAYPGFNRTIFFNNGYPYGNINGYNGYPVNYNNVSYNNGYPYGNQYSNYDERINTPQGIVIIHHVLVACPQPVQQVYSVSIPAPVTPSYQQVSAAPQAVAPQVYAQPVQQLSGYIFPPRTGDAGLLSQTKSSNSWLPDFVLVGLLGLFSMGIMARARQR
jgi:hypothetical protein